jgi:hypothetical protein
MNKELELFHTERGKLAYKNLITSIYKIEQIFESIIEKENNVIQLLQLRISCLREVEEEKRKIITTALEIDRSERILQANIALSMIKLEKE